MKKLLLGLAALLLCACAGCGTGTNTLTLDADEIPAGTLSMYRGEVTACDIPAELDDADDTRRYPVALRQVAGTSFGAGELEVVISRDTSLTFDLLSLAEGDYLEVYYSAQPPASGVEVYNAVIANKLPPAESCVLNGEVTGLLRNARGGLSGMELQPLEGDGTVVVHFSDTTSFYLDFDKIQQGEVLNVYTDGVTTDGIPPETTAREVRLYAG